MNKKVYSKPSMKAITLKHRIGLICQSGGKSVTSARNSENIGFAGSIDDTYSDN